MRPRVSLVIPNKNNEPALDLVFERLAEHTTYPDFEVVVVDDGSDDDSRTILRRWRDSGRFERFVYEEQAPSGVVVTLNRCLELATGEVCVQLDADATVETPGWLEKMLALLESDERIGVVSPRVVFDFGAVHAYGVNIVGPEGLHDRTTTITEPAGRRTLHENVQRIAPEHTKLGARVAEVDTGIGCCMMYRREDALAVGGYDMGFQPVWFDDLDLALSIRHKLSKKAFFLPDVLVVHRVELRTTRGEVSRREVFEARVGRMLPDRLKRALKDRAGVGGPAPEKLERLRHHYAYWQSKWGWDLINPDMDAVLERYAGTEVVWAYEDERRRAGEEIAARFEATRPEAVTLTPYDHILDVLGSGLPDGDVVEIGVFLGGGVAQMARTAPERRVIAVDVFDPDTDVTPAQTGTDMRSLYRHVLGDADQRTIYDAVAGGLENVETVVGDSAVVEIPTERIAFAHIDGNHDPEYVRGDFEKVWAKTVPGGVVAFDDYGHDLPQVTRAIDALRAERDDEIARFWTAGQKTAFVQKR